MTQRIFDVDNPQKIFDLFPDDIVRIKKSIIDGCWACYKDGGEADNVYVPLKINWRDKTEITRPADKSKWIGCLCWFWDKDEQPFLAVLKKIMPEERYKYTTTDGEFYKYCRPARRDEIKFVDDAESKE